MADPEIERLWRWLEAHDRKEDTYHETVNTRLSSIENTLSRVKGGWAMLAIIGTVLASLAVGFAWVFDHFPKR